MSILKIEISKTKIDISIMTARFVFNLYVTIHSFSKLIFLYRSAGYNS